jgi:transcriptional regulator with XRE-family HTH domain
MRSTQPERELLPLDLAAQSGGGPTALRITLGTQLRRLREARGITREDAGYAIRASHAKISRMELGRVGFKERDLIDLLAMYGVPAGPEQHAFLDLARQANTPGWWHKFGDVVPPWFETYVGLEQACAVIRAYEAQFVPGLLQTEEVARAVIRLGHPEGAPAEVDRRVDLRMRRQRVLTGPDAPSMWAVLDEGALRRPIGGRQVQRAQLRHLREMAELPNVTLQVILTSSGGHAGAGGPFTILRFSEPDLPDIVYLEQLTSALYLEKRGDVDHYLAVMDRLCVQAAQPQETLAILERLADEV